MPKPSTELELELAELEPELEPAEGQREMVAHALTMADQELSHAEPELEPVQNPN